MRNEVGIVIATYNGEKYVAEQLKSVLAQTRVPDLIVVSDGSSSDDTVGICSRILLNSSIPYVVFTSDVRLSVVQNFEKALSYCDSDYIFLADQDDVWMPSKIQAMLTLIKEHNADLVFTNATIVDEHLNTVYKKSLWESIGYGQNETVRIIDACERSFVEELLRHNVVTGMCMCISQFLKQKILPLSTHSIHDAWIALVAANMCKMIALDQEYVLYRQHASNVIGTESSLVRAILRRNGYAKRVGERREAILELLQKTNDIAVEECIHVLRGYAAYLSGRISFLNKESGLFFPLHNKRLYKQYEQNARSIVIKDYFARFFDSGGKIIDE